MELLKNWIMGIAAASVLLAAAKTLIPKGSVKQVGEFACGLILLLAVSAPLVKLDLKELSIALTELRMAEAQSSELLRLENNMLIKEIIEEKTAAYISDKAKGLGMECAAEVTYEYSEEGRTYPVSVKVTGRWTEAQRSRLEALIEADLAVSKDKQTYEEENDP